MKFRCNDWNCREQDPEAKTYREVFRFRAKPTVDERSECPKCGRWCHKCGHSPKDIHIRGIDILFKKHQSKAMTEYQYRHLNTWNVPRLKEAVEEVKMGMEGLVE